MRPPQPSVSRAPVDQLTNLEFAGEHNGEVTYDVSLESAGELTFAAA